MGNRQGGEKSAKEDKEEKKRRKREKKARKKGRKRGVGGSDVDVDPDSSQVSHADSESIVFHSAENLSPYLDASTRSEEGAACPGYTDNAHIFSSQDFHDGFSLEACLPADLASAADDVTASADGGFSTPLLSSPDVRRGLPRSPMAQRQKDSFLEPVPPIPSDFSSTTLSSASNYQDNVSTSGTERSSSRASSSTVDTNAAHCIERLEELERKIERTIIEKFAPSPDVQLRRKQFEEGDRSREGSVTPKGDTGFGSLASRSVENSPGLARRGREAAHREGSMTPKGVVAQGVWSQSAENSPVIVRRALPTPDSPIIMRRTPSQSPSVERKFPVNSPVLMRRRGADPSHSPNLSPSLLRRVPESAMEHSPRLAASHKSPVPPPVPPKPVKMLTSPDIARRLQNMPKSPIMPRKVYAFQEQQGREAKDSPLGRSRKDQHMALRSPSRSPEVRPRMAGTILTPSPSPSPQLLARKLVPVKERAAHAAPLSPGTASAIQICQQRGIPVKQCLVTQHAQPSTAVVLENASSQSPVPPPAADPVLPQNRTQSPNTRIHDPPADKPQPETVSQDAIKNNTESAVFGSISPKLKRQKQIISIADESKKLSSFDSHRTESFDSSPRSPLSSPPRRRGGREGGGSGGPPTAPKPSMNVLQSKGKEAPHSPAAVHESGDGKREGLVRQASSKDEGTLSADIAGGLTFHTHLPSDLSEGDSGQVHRPLTTTTTSICAGPVLVRPDNAQDSKKGDRTVIEGSTVYGRENSETHVSQKTVLLAPASQSATIPSLTPTTATSVSSSTGVAKRRQFIAGNTVSKNAAGTAGSISTTQGNAALKTPLPPLSASGEETAAITCTEEREAIGAASKDRLSAPDAEAQGLGKSLGQRIKEVITESSFKETFTAELSSSSLDRDDVTYTSDDSVFARNSGQDWALPVVGPRDNFCGRSRERKVSDSPTASPRAKRAKPSAPGRGSAEKGDQTSACVSEPVNQPQGFGGDNQGTVIFSNVQFPPDATAIRRIDVDVNVRLPQGHSQQQVAEKQTSHVQAGPRCPVSNQITGGQIKSTMEEPSQKDDCSTANPSLSTDIVNNIQQESNPKEKTALENQNSKKKEETESALKSRLTQTAENKTASRKETGQAVATEQSLSSPKNASEKKKGGKQGKVHSGATPLSPLPPSAAAVNISEGGREKVPSLASSAGGEEIPASYVRHTTEQDGTQPSSAAAKGPATQTPDTNSSSHLATNKLASQSSVKTGALQDEVSSIQGNNDMKTTPSSSPPHASVDSPQNEQSAAPENVPPPSPTALELLAEEDEEEEEEEEDGHLVNAHQESDISSKISQEMQAFGETVVKRLSSLLESHASESDSCLEETRTDLLRPQDPRTPKQNKVVGATEEETGDSVGKEQLAKTSSSNQQASLISPEAEGDVPEGVSHQAAPSEEIEPVLPDDLNTFASSDLPGERLVTSDTTETLSTDHDTSASSKRESTTSTATDETLTSFQGRSTTDSLEFDDNFVLPGTLVFVRSGDDPESGGGGRGAVMESGKIVKRPSIPSELTKSVPPADSHPPKPRKKRRRQAASYDVTPRADVTEPVPKRNSKQIRDVIDAYCDEDESDTSLSSSTDDVIREGVYHPAVFSKSESKPPRTLPVEPSYARKAKPPADRSTDSTDSSEDLAACKRRCGSSSSRDSASFRIPEIEETFGELMGVKTLLDDLEDQTPTSSQPQPIHLGLGAESKSKDFWSFRRSRTSPAKTDRTESDLDVSEQRDDASTDSMYADDEDEGTEVVFQRSYSEEHGGEVLLSCTIYNSAHDKDRDSDEFWADPEAAAGEESYKALETAADAAGSAFQNARIQMHDIHQHLQDLRRQMELLQDDITSTSLTLTPDFSLESEHRPLTE